MKFSFLMCINKKQPFMYAAINSMFEQNYNDEYEVIIIANNCSDDLWEELKNIVKDKKNCILERTKIGQLAFNLNYGINIAKGDYIVRMDADDISNNKRLSLMEKKIELEKYPDVIGSCVELIDDKSNYISTLHLPLTNEDIRKKLIFKSPFVHPSTCIKKEIILKVGGYLGGYQSEDYDLWIRLARNKNVNFINIKDVILQYRITNEQSRGRKLPYAEVVSHYMREFILYPKFTSALSLFVSFWKAIFLSDKK